MEEEKKEIVAVEKLEIPALKFDNEEDAISTIEQKWTSIPDTEDKAGYELVRVGISEAVSLRGKIDERRKELKRDANAWKKKVDEFTDGMIERIRKVENKLKSAKAVVDDRKKREKEEKARLEAERVAGIRQRIASIQEAGLITYGTPLSDMDLRYGQLKNVDVSKDVFQEFFAEADVAYNGAIQSVAKAIEAEKQRIADEELKRKEAEAEAERQRIERERLQREREEQEKIRKEQEEKLAAERAEFERLKAEAEKLRLEEEARLQAEREARDEAEEKARKEREEAERIDREKRDAEEQARREEEEKKRAEEQEKIDAENARLAEERAEIEREKEAQRKRDEQRRMEEEAEKARLADEKQRANNRLDLLHTLNDMDAKNELLPELICDAIINGVLPHVEYRG